MPQMDLTPQMIVGVESIDKQHEHLFALCNSFILALSSGSGPDVVEEVFAKLKAYTCYHFADEEQYMKELDYPDFAKHKADHDCLLQEVDAFRTRLNEASPPSPAETMDFLNKWISHHILVKDTAIGKFAMSK